ncbi:MAG TPA: tryptophan synthase subunit alpha [Candidatus Omnitrophota bacterium]|nr:tryptophan synthase subunit alpha [Candidatus Omnitrophota bacterium]HPS20158.1 tryptophan synthase subunit alpha [Candidatus Omnitrophota bacterium]
MNRISDTFEKLKREKKKAFIVYITAGDPSLKTTAELVKELERSGADIVELGIPFSDPMADGPTIQRAVQRSLNAGCTVKGVFDMVRNLRKEVNIPLVFMTYYNIVFNYGVKKFVSDAKLAGVDGIIVPDLPMEESDELAEAGKGKDFSVILLAAPTTSRERFKQIAKKTTGFIYYVSLAGVTGARKVVPTSVAGTVKKLQKLTDKPVCVGFGVSDPSQAKTLSAAASGVIVGSAVINVIEKYSADKGKMIKAVGKFASGIASAVHGGN